MISIKRFIIMMAIFSFGKVMAQPVNPIFNFSTEVRFDVDMQPLAIMDIESSGATADFTLSTSIPEEAGNNFGNNPIATNSSTWLNYSCANRDVLSRHIEVYISSGTIPQGFQLQLQVSNSLGVGGGTLGAPHGAVTLSSSSQTILSGIKGCFTGDGPYNGHQLTYSLHYNPLNFNLLQWQSQDIVISFTIVDD